MLFALATALMAMEREFFCERSGKHWKGIEELAKLIAVCTYLVSVELSEGRHGCGLSLEMVCGRGWWEVGGRLKLAVKKISRGFSVDVYGMMH
jgi:hypothetical protein